MCGFGLLITSNILQKDSIQKRIDSITKLQKSRGPDYQGNFIKINDHYSLIAAHQRLSIIDNSYLSNQPLISKCKNYVLLFNGEIYNYKNLRKNLGKIISSTDSSGDTGVLLDLLVNYGKESLNELRGMWSFAFIDFNKEKVIYSRDPIGIKPLFFYKDSKNFSLASTELGLLGINNLDLLPNKKKVSESIANGFVENNYETFYKNIFQIKPGTVAEYSFKEGKINSKEKLYKSGTKLIPNKAKNNSEDFEKILKESVKFHFEADTQIGIAASGGIDSSLLTILSNNLNFKFPIFTIKNENVSDSENKALRYIAKYNNIELYQKKINLKDIRLCSHIKGIEYLSRPNHTFSHIAYSKLMERVSEKGIKCILSGQGADEILLGYKKYKILYIIDLFFERNYYEFIKQIWFIIRYGQLFNYLEIYDLIRVFKSLKKIIEKSLFNFKKINFKSEKIDFVQKNRFISTMQEKDLNQNILDMLSYEDRISMAYGIEVRVPFIDKEVIDYALDFNPKLLLGTHLNKKILLDILRKYLPSIDLFKNKKMGLDMDERKIAFNLFRDLGPIASWELVNKKYLSRIYILTLKNLSYLFPVKKIIVILNTELWLRNILRIKESKILK